MKDFNSYTTFIFQLAIAWEMTAETTVTVGVYKHVVKTS